MMNWKDRALQAADTKATLERDEQRRRDETELAKQVEAFRFALGELLEEDVTVDALQVTVDGVTFAWTINPNARKYGIVLQGVCPDCGASTWSRHISTLEEIGRLLQHFTPESDHVKEHLNTPTVKDHVRTTPMRDSNAS
jgi:Fe-S cluster biogenesis protein NfuA